VLDYGGCEDDYHDMMCDNGADSEEQQQEETSPTSSFPLLNPYSLYGWCPDITLTDDENYMDLVLLLTRNSADNQTTQRHCASLLVDPTLLADGSSPLNEIKSVTRNQIQLHEFQQRFFGSIIGAATNQPLFSPEDSDIHAEIACLSQACRNRCSTNDCTMFITIPPCKRCFAALVTFGIKRIVSRQLPPHLIIETAKQNNIEITSFCPDENRSQMKRINELVNHELTDEELMGLVHQRKQWRESKRLERKNKKSLRESSITLKE
jgi:tRNA(Arg) A34 adenosine deaminase TadA